MTPKQAEERPPAGLAVELVHEFGPRAREIAEERASTSVQHPELAARWRSVASAIMALVQADLHMAIALDLLDAVGETRAATKLDEAIGKLGLRSPEETARQLDQERSADDPHRRRAQQHLDLARSEPDTILKRLHLDTAARYATLGELAAWST